MSLVVALLYPDLQQILQRLLALPLAPGSLLESVGIALVQAHHRLQAKRAISFARPGVQNLECGRDISIHRRPNNPPSCPQHPPRLLILVLLLTTPSSGPSCFPIIIRRWLSSPSKSPSCVVRLSVHGCLALRHQQERRTQSTELPASFSCPRTPPRHPPRLQSPSSPCPWRASCIRRSPLSFCRFHLTSLGLSSATPSRPPAPIVKLLTAPRRSQCVILVRACFF